MTAPGATRLEAFQTINCMDIDERLSVEEDDATAPMFTEVAPRFAPAGTTGSYFCTFFPASTDPRLEITAAGAGPILVCGTTGNSSAPLQGTRAMADTLEDSHLIVVDAISAGVSECRSAPTTSSPTTSSTSTCPPPQRPTARRNSVENARRSGRPACR